MDDLLGLVRYALGCTLALAAFWKVRDFGAFRRSLAAYGLHGLVGRAGASALIGAEALAAAAALTPAADRVVGVAAAALGLAFTVAQTHLLATGTRASCLCFGASAAEPVSLRSWSRAALVLLAGLLLVFAGDVGPRSVDPLLLAGGVLLIAGLTVLYRRASVRAGARPG